MKKLGFSLAALLVVALVGFIVAWRLFVDYLRAPTLVDRREPKVVEIPKGLSESELAQWLGAQGLVTRPGWLTLYLEHFYEGREPQPGEYTLTPNLSPVELVDRLTRGNVVTHTVVIEPGLRARAIAQRLAAAGLVNEEAFVRRLFDREAMARLGLPGESFEGYLLPETYVLAKGIPDMELLERLVKRYREHVTPEILDAARVRGLVEHQLLTLASMVELAGGPPTERGQIAAVFLNRMKAGLPLEDDATLAYGLKKSVEELTAADREQPSAYNTYLIQGLPPGPICSPSFGSIAATANPVQTEALYFAPIGDGTHLFCHDEQCYRDAMERAGLPVHSRAAKKPGQKPK